MKRIVQLHVFLVLTFCISECVFDSDKSEPLGKGTYSLEVQQADIRSYPGGGGLFMLSLMPGEDFEGAVKLSVQAEPSLNLHLTTEYLSSEKRIAEVEIRPAANTAIQEYTLNVKSKNEDTSDTLTLKANIVKPDSMAVYGDYAKTRLSGFVRFLQDTHSEFGITSDLEWFGYSHSPTMMCGGSTWTFLNQTWDVTVVSVVLPGAPKWYLLRKRGEHEPIFAAYEERELEMHEIPLSEYYEAFNIKR